MFLEDPRLVEWNLSVSSRGAKAQEKTKTQGHPTKEKHAPGSSFAGPQLSIIQQGAALDNPIK